MSLTKVSTLITPSTNLTSILTSLSLSATTPSFVHPSFDGKSAKRKFSSTIFFENIKFLYNMCSFVYQIDVCEFFCDKSVCNEVQDEFVRNSVTIIEFGVLIGISVFRTIPGTVPDSCLFSLNQLCSFILNVKCQLCWLTVTFC